MRAERGGGGGEEPCPKMDLLSLNGTEGKEDLLCGFSGGWNMKKSEVRGMVH